MKVMDQWLAQPSVKTALHVSKQGSQVRMLMLFAKHT